ncbi:MAG: biopolymer transporter ExbD [Polyangiaceae bacterium]
MNRFCPISSRRALLAMLLTLAAEACGASGTMSESASPTAESGEASASPTAMSSSAQPAPTQESATAPVVEIPGPPASSKGATELELPRASDAGDLAPVLGVELRASGEILVDGKQVADQTQLSEVARAAYSKNPDIRAVIRADARVIYGRVVEILDVVKSAGIRKVALAVARAGGH